MSANEITLFLNVVHDLRITNAITLALFVVLIYDILLTFPDELEYVWKAKWSYGKALFFLNRYPVAVVSTLLIVGETDVASDLKMCAVSYRLEGWSMLAFIIPVQLIFCLRTTALWERNRKVLIFLIVVMLACDSIIAVFIWMSERFGSFMLPQTPGLKDLLGCYATLTGWSSPKNIIPAVAALMTFDAVILFLTILRFIKIRKDGEGNGFVVRIFFRDGVIYYVVVLVSSIANLILYAVIQRRHAALLGALVPILRTVMSVCASRLILNLRGAIDRVRVQPWTTEDFRSTGISEPEQTEHHAMELQLRLGPAFAYEFRNQGQEESGEPAFMRTLYRPQSTTVVKAATSIRKDGASDALPCECSTVLEGGAAFDLVCSHGDGASELPMGVAV